MTSPFAKCFNCDALFPALSLNFIDSTNVSIKNSTAGPCPSCGGIGQILDGVYDFQGDLIKLLSGPKSTFDTLMAVGLIVRTSRERGDKPEDTLKKAIEASPTFGKWAEKFAMPILSGIIFPLIVGLSLKVFEDKPLSSEDARLLVSQTITSIYQEQRKNLSPPSVPLDRPPVALSAPKARAIQCQPKFPKSLAKLEAAMKQGNKGQGMDWPFNCKPK